MGVSGRARVVMAMVMVVVMVMVMIMPVIANAGGLDGPGAARISAGVASADRAVNRSSAATQWR